MGKNSPLRSIRLFVCGGNPQSKSSKETAENSICEYCVCTTVLFPEVIEPGVIMVLGCYFIVVFVCLKSASLAGVVKPTLKNR